MTSSLLSFGTLRSLAGFAGPAGLAPSASTLAAGAAAAAGAKASSMLSKAPPPIDWASYNWPTSLEVGGLSFGVLHFDLAELKEKRDTGVYALALNGYRWWSLTMALSALNFLDCVVLAAVAGPAYPGINALFSLLWAMVWAPLGMAVVYQSYKGYAENSAAAKMAAKAGAVIVAILLLVMCFGAFGSLNGFASLGGPRLQRDFVGAGGSSDGQHLWTAIVVIESLLWCCDAAAFGWVARRIFLGPAAVNVAEAVK